jgi:hypothetical protein
VLLGNYSVLHKSPLRFFGGSTTSVEPQLRSNFNKSGPRRNSLYTSGATAALTLYSVPSGNAAGKTWLLPQKSGEMSSRNDCVMTLTAAGAGVGGITSTGSASLSILADGVGSLITSGAGSATVNFTADGFLTASLQAVGAASFSISTNSPLLGAEASLVGSAAFAITGSLTPYAIGAMTGSTVDATAVTVDAVASAVWGAVAASNNMAGSMGAKLNTASSGGVDLNALASAVWAHTVRSLTGNQAVRVDDIWQRLGLDPANPLTTDTNAGTIEAGTVSQTAAEPSTGVSVITRIP